jgi:hypothetical protein
MCQLVTACFPPQRDIECRTEEGAHPRCACPGRAPRGASEAAACAPPELARPATTHQPLAAYMRRADPSGCATARAQRVARARRGAAGGRRRQGGRAGRADRGRRPVPVGHRRPGGRRAGAARPPARRQGLGRPGARPRAPAARAVDVSDAPAAGVSWGFSGIAETIGGQAPAGSPASSCYGRERAGGGACSSLIGWRRAGGRPAGERVPAQQADAGGAGAGGRLGAAARVRVRLQQAARRVRGRAWPAEADSSRVTHSRVTDALVGHVCPRTSTKKPHSAMRDTLPRRPAQRAPPAAGRGPPPAAPRGRPRPGPPCLAGAALTPGPGAQVRGGARVAREGGRARPRPRGRRAGGPQGAGEPGGGGVAHPRRAAGGQGARARARRAPPRAGLLAGRPCSCEVVTLAPRSRYDGCKKVHAHLTIHGVVAGAHVCAGLRCESQPVVRAGSSPGPLRRRGGHRVMVLCHGTGWRVTT